MAITKSKVVSIEYTLTDDQNKVIDSTIGQSPLDYLHGFGNIIPGLENALEGRAQGDHFSVHIPAAEAYGERDERLIAGIPRTNFEETELIEPGMQFHAHSPEGIRMFTVTAVAGDTITVDGNHPLAGMDLTFEVTIAGIRDASEEELSHGHVHGHGHGGCGDGCGGEKCGDCGCDGH
jgi:FKBP-type peptidyl-prolyl cis-trans isomerase SlyD